MSVAVKIDGHHDMTEGRFQWSFGDGGSANLYSNQPLSHIYYYPGIYQVALTYYSSSVKPDPDYIFKKSIKIIPATLSVTGTTDDAGLIIKNDSTGDIDLGNWVVGNSAHWFVFPQNTVVGSGSQLNISSNTLGLKTFGINSVQLMNPSGVVMLPVPKIASQIHSKQTDVSSTTLDDQDWAALSSNSQNKNPILPSPPVPTTKSQAYTFIRTHSWIFILLITILLVAVAHTIIRRYYKPNNPDSGGNPNFQVDEFL